MPRLACLLFLAACTTSQAPPAPTPTPSPAAAPASQPTAEAEAPPQAAPEAEDAAPARVAVEPERHEAEPGHAGLIEMLGSQGACSGVTEKPLAALAWKRPAGMLYAAECERFAYQSSFEWWLEPGDGMKRVNDPAGNPVNTLGYPMFSADGRVSWLEKARGVGDCGDWYLYQHEGTTLTLVEHRARACDVASEYTEPPTWPLVK